VLAGCVGTTEIWTKVTWSFSRIVVLPPPLPLKILLRPTFYIPSLEGAQ
jgi:hypothetical protein